jgi:hypothetical protein
VSCTDCLHSVVFITPIAFNNIGYRTWIIFAATNLAIIPIVYFLYPETAFRSLEEVDVIFALADDEPGNPWLSVVRISKNEPLWFGKRGEKRSDFQYQNSSWHKRLVGSSGSSGNGTGSDSNRVMNEKDQAAEDFNRSLQPPTEAGMGTVTSNCYAGQNNGYRPGSPESPIDPRLLPPSSDDNSPTSTMQSKKLRKKPSRTQHKDSISSEPTLIHHDSQDSADPPPIHRNKSERDTWYQSKESLTSAEATGTPVWYNPDTAPAMPPVVHRTRSRSNSSSPPSPGRYEIRDSRPTSRGRQRRSRPTTADTQRSFLVDDDSEHHALTVDERVETESLSSVNYPGRLDGDARTGLHRTVSGRETYFPDGIVNDLRDGSVERSVERRLSNGTVDGRRFAPRDSGRAY